VQKMTREQELEGLGAVGIQLTGKQLLIFRFYRLPDPKLYPNELRKMHWAVRSEHEKTARTEAYYLGMLVQAGMPVLKYHCEVMFNVVPSSKGKYKVRDLDGMISAVKPWLDGLCLPQKDGDIGCGLLFDDDCWHMLSLRATAREANVDQTVISIHPVVWAKEYQDV